jgi:tetratricopeptide (TPR) repeat protein
LSVVLLAIKPVFAATQCLVQTGVDDFECGLATSHRFVGSIELCKKLNVMAVENLQKSSCPVLSNRLLRWLIIGVLVLAVSACSTTASKPAQPKKTVKKSCSTANSQQQGSKAPKDGGASGVLQNECLPRGVIEIAENYEIAPEIREEFNEANLLLKEEKFPQAIRLLKGVTGKTSKFSAPFINLGIAYARTGELKKAEESLKKALQINSRHPVASNELGLVYRQTGRYQEARELYESLLTMYPDFLPAHKNLGVLCDIYIQDLECALKQYQEYLRGIPDDKKVKIWVADVKSRM